MGGRGGPVTVAPLFVLYDYTFRPPGCSTKEESLAKAYAAGVVCTDETFLHPDPYPVGTPGVAHGSRSPNVGSPNAAPTCRPCWSTTIRWSVAPTDVLWYPEFAQWCGTELTADWHTRFDVTTVVYGHLHIPRSTRYDGVPFEEVSLGYPREWRPRGPAPAPRQILPTP